LKLASSDFGVWLIIAIIFGIAKMWNRFASSAPDDDEPAPPPARPRPQPRPRPQARPSVPPPPRRQVERNVPPVAKPVTQPTWETAPKDLREFMERLTRTVQPKPASPPPIARPAPPPAPKPAAPTPAPVAAKPAPTPARRASPWIEAFRDRQNLRNIIIANEIIGPPRGA
jgi:hypothetical protein